MPICVYGIQLWGTDKKSFSKNKTQILKSIILCIDHKICEMPHFIFLTTPNIYTDLIINIIVETVKITQIH